MAESISQAFAKDKQKDQSLQFKDWIASYQQEKKPVSEQDYLKAVQAATPTQKQINEATQAGVHSITGEPLNITSKQTSEPKTAGQWIDDKFYTGVDQTTKSPFQQWKAGEISHEEYLASVKQVSTERQKQESINAGRTEAIGEAIKAKIGDEPPPPDTSEMSYEDKLKALADHQKQLADYYKEWGKQSQKELGDVSAQVLSFGDQLKQYQGALDALSAQISSPDNVQALDEVIAEVGQTGSGSITPEALAKIRTISDLSPQEFKSQVRAILSSSVSAAALQSAGVTDNGDSYTLSNGVTIPKSSTGAPDLRSTAIPSNASAYDIALLELTTNNELAEGALTIELEKLKDLSDSVRRATETAKNEINAMFDTASNKIDEEKLKALNEAKYREAKLELEKDKSLDNILEQEAKMEGFMKGQLEAWGATESSAALSVMGDIKNKFLKQYTQTAQGYDIELSRVSDLMMEASMAYTNRSLEIANNKAIALEKVNNGLLDNIDKIFTETSAAYQNRDLKLLQNNTKYFGDVQEIKAYAEKAALEAERDARDYQFNLIKMMADNSDLAFEISSDGTVKLKLDENGFPISKTEGGTFVPGGVNSGNGKAVPIAETTAYLNGLDSNYLSGIGNGNIMTGSPWVNGIDVDGKIGDPITAPTSGTVVRAVGQYPRQSGSYGQKGFGNNVLIRTDDGKLIQFSHLDSINVQAGDRISAGSVLGAMGNTGFVIPGEKGDGSHVDITMWQNNESAGLTKEEAILGLDQQTGTRPRPTGNEEVDFLLNQIYDGVFTIDDFPVDAKTEGERKRNIMLHTAYSAQASIFEQPAEPGILERISNYFSGGSLSDKLDEARAKYPGSTEDDFVLQDGEFVFSPDRVVDIYELPPDVLSTVEYINARQSNEALGSIVSNLTKKSKNKKILVDAMEQAFGKDWSILRLSDIDNDLVAESILKAKAEVNKLA